MSTVFISTVDKAALGEALGKLYAVGMRLTPIGKPVGPLQRYIAIPATPKPLSPRSYQVLLALAEGHTNPVLAADMGVTVDTAKEYTRHLYKQIGARDRAHAVAIGYRQGILTAPKGQHQ
jgi:DNA-binding NarL/FixJ family response regulator